MWFLSIRYYIILIKLSVSAEVMRAYSSKLILCAMWGPLMGRGMIQSPLPSPWCLYRAQWSSSTGGLCSVHEICACGTQCCLLREGSPWGWVEDICSLYWPNNNGSQISPAVLFCVEPYPILLWFKSTETLGMSYNVLTVFDTQLLFVMKAVLILIFHLGLVYQIWII